MEDRSLITRVCLHMTRMAPNSWRYQHRKYIGHVRFLDRNRSYCSRYSRRCRCSMIPYAPCSQSQTSLYVFACSSPSSAGWRGTGSSGGGHGEREDCLVPQRKLIVSTFSSSSFSQRDVFICVLSPCAAARVPVVSSCVMFHPAKRERAQRRLRARCRWPLSITAAGTAVFVVVF